MPNYFNFFNLSEYGGKLLDRLGVSYERAYMATPKKILYGYAGPSYLGTID